MDPVIFVNVEGINVMATMVTADVHVRENQKVAFNKCFFFYSMSFMYSDKSRLLDYDWITIHSYKHKTNEI